VRKDDEREHGVTEMAQEQLQGWVGRSEERQDVLALEQALRMAVLFDLETLPAVGDELPQLWHWAYFAPHVRQSSIDVDGHPVRGGLLPPIDLPRRMWAGSRVRFVSPLRIGEQVTRRSEILSVEPKSGKQGKLVFVTVRHTLSNEGRIAIDEEQDIVYREPLSASAPVPEVRQAEWSDALTPDAVMLFRYSALTYNAHRIHYDLPYTKEVESYPGLVVQGPMTATLLLAACLRRTGARASTFRFRGQSPLFADQLVRLCGCAGKAAGEYDLWAEGEGGYSAMSAHATVENS
jgi:3-methylfumaryl-CoA hydratase